MKILTAEQMRNIDHRATDRFGIPSIVLMENAAVAVVEALSRHYPEADRVAILCGPGQNGGDGFAIARHLENRGVVPVLLVIGDRAHYSGDALTNLQICERLGLPLYDIKSSSDVDEALVHASDADVIIDAIFGTGLNRAPEGVFADVIRVIAELRLPVIAVDLPSGANASSSEPFEPCIQAEYTVTFAAPKICHIFEPAAAYCGEVAVADIAIPDIAIEDEGVELGLITPRDIQPFVMARFATSHKGTYGHVAIVAGSPGRSGAAVMAARGAVRSGAGLVTVATDHDTAAIVHAGSTESMTLHVEGDDASAVIAAFEGKTAAVIGPGLRDDEACYEYVRQLVSHTDLPLVIDASALNAFAGRLADINPHGHPRVITPHPGELARLSGTSTKEIAEDRIGAARAAAKACRCIVVLKGYQSLIAEPDGHVWVNPTGNPGMATGGMGDVLSGMIGAFLARGLDPIDAAMVSAYLHGLAGDMLKEQMGDTGLAATDLAERIPYAIQRVRG
jgi:ADP-dependent NAD(P)H-hydrate dehydratase / NAD(P)H-hydrate epimerase